MNNNELIQVLLVGGNEAEREELSQMLSSQEGITVVGEARSGEEALVEATKLSPDVVLMFTDNSYLDMNVIDAARAINEAQLPARVIIIAENISRYLAPAVKAGAAGLLSKNVGYYDELLSAIDKIHRWYPGSIPSGQGSVKPGNQAIR